MRWSTAERTPATGGPGAGRAGTAAAPLDDAPPDDAAQVAAPLGDLPAHPGTAPLSEHPAVLATVTALSALGARHGVQEVPAGLRTPADLADHLGVAPAAVATTALLTTGPGPGRGRGDLVLVVASAVHHLFPPTLAAVLGLSAVDLLGDAEVLRCTGSVLGSASPVGLTGALTTYVDVTLAPHPTIWVPAGHPHAVFRTRYDELLRLTGGHPVEIG